MKGFKLQYGGNVNNGVLSINRRDKMKKDVNHFEGKNVIITIEEHVETKTIPQLGYLFGVVYQCAYEGFYDSGDRITFEQARHEMESMSPILKDRYFIGTEGKERQIRLSEKLANIEVVKEHIDWCIDHILVFFNIEVPLPETYFTGKKQEFNIWT